MTGKCRLAHTASLPSSHAPRGGIRAGRLHEGCRVRLATVDCPPGGPAALGLCGSKAQAPADASMHAAAPCPCATCAARVVACGNLILSCCDGSWSPGHCLCFVLFFRRSVPVPAPVPVPVVSPGPRHSPLPGRALPRTLATARLREVPVGKPPREDEKIHDKFHIG